MRAVGNDHMNNGETAILMAAGLGSRMRPVTDESPKPLVRVKGRAMIETIIEGLRTRGVEHFYIVTGYLAQQFEPLAAASDDITLIHNDAFKTHNNISSVYAARDILGTSDTFICEADLFIPKPDVFLTDLRESCYFGKMKNGYSDDWVFDQDASGRIIRVGKGGTDVYNMCGISFFKRADAAILKEKIVQAYHEPGNEQLFWDEVVDRNLDALDLKVHPIVPDQIVEIDTVKELAAMDESYRKYVGKE